MGDTMEAGGTFVTAEWLEARRAAFLKSRRFILVMWAVSYLCPLFLLLLPVLGFKTNPAVMHGHARLFQLLMAGLLAFYMTVLYSSMIRKNRAALKIIEGIFARGPKVSEVISN